MKEKIAAEEMHMNDQGKISILEQIEKDEAYGITSMGQLDGASGKDDTIIRHE